MAGGGAMRCKVGKLVFLVILTVGVSCAKAVRYDEGALIGFVLTIKERRES